jgi:hypothetical protein
MWLQHVIITSKVGMEMHKCSLQGWPLDHNRYFQGRDSAVYQSRQKLARRTRSPSTTYLTQLTNLMAKTPPLS